MSIAITQEQRDILRHSLCGSGSRPYRNCYCVESGCIDDRSIQQLINMGLMKRGRTINEGRNYYAHVTDAGAKEIDLELPKD
jgi:hypothetical protein